MNKLLAVKSLVYGVLMASLCYFVIRPSHDDVIRIKADAEGYYRQSDTDNYTVEVTTQKDGELRIDYRELRDKVEYVMLCVIGLLFAVWKYKEYPEVMSQRRNIHDTRLVTEHPRYKEFMELDPERSHYKGDDLVYAFSSWLSGQLYKKSEKQNE